MKTSYDVLVIGAGPAGSTAAHRLAGAGYGVAMVEEHAVIGEPVDCTGILGLEAFEALALPPGIVVGSVDAVTIQSPAGIPASYRGEAPLAYIVDRAELDRTLASRAQEKGAAPFLNTQAIDVARGACGVKVTCRTSEGELRHLSAKVLILAGGPRFAFHERLGLRTRRQPVRAVLHHPGHPTTHCFCTACHLTMRTPCCFQKRHETAQFCY